MIRSFFVLTAIIDGITVSGRGNCPPEKNDFIFWVARASLNDWYQSSTDGSVWVNSRSQGRECEEWSFDQTKPRDFLSEGWYLDNDSRTWWVKVSSARPKKLKNVAGWFIVGIGNNQRYIDKRVEKEAYWLMTGHKRWRKALDKIFSTLSSIKSRSNVKVRSRDLRVIYLRASAPLETLLAPWKNENQKRVYGFRSSWRWTGRISSKFETQIKELEEISEASIAFSENRQNIIGMENLVHPSSYLFNSEMKSSQLATDIFESSQYITSIARQLNPKIAGFLAEEIVYERGYLLAEDKFGAVGNINEARMVGDTIRLARLGNIFALEQRFKKVLRSIEESELHLSAIDQSLYDQTGFIFFIPDLIKATQRTRDTLKRLSVPYITLRKYDIPESVRPLVKLSRQMRSLLNSSWFTFSWSASRVRKNINTSLPLHAQKFASLKDIDYLISKIEDKDADEIFAKLNRWSLWEPSMAILKIAKTHAGHRYRDIIPFLKSD